MIFRLDAHCNRFQNITTDDSEDWDLLLGMRGQPMGKRWRPVPVHVIREGRQNKRLPASGFPSLISHLPTFSPRAKEVFEDLLGNTGEWLRLTSNEGDYWIFNVTDVRDALDIGASECLFFDDGKLMQVNRYKFIAAKLANAVVFRLRPFPMEVFVTDAFIVRVKSAQLRGFEFVSLSDL
jgi:hypothetical protein